MSGIIPAAKCGTADYCCPWYARELEGPAGTDDVIVVCRHPRCRGHAERLLASKEDLYRRFSGCPHGQAPLLFNVEPQTRERRDEAVLVFQYLAAHPERQRRYFEALFGPDTSIMPRIYRQTLASAVAWAEDGQ